MKANRKCNRKLIENALKVQATLKRFLWLKHRMKEKLELLILLILNEVYYLKSQ